MICCLDGTYSWSKLSRAHFCDQLGCRILKNEREIPMHLGHRFGSPWHQIYTPIASYCSLFTKYSKCFYLDQICMKGCNCNEFQILHKRTVHPIYVRCLTYFCSRPGFTVISPQYGHIYSQHIKYTNNILTPTKWK